MLIEFDDEGEAIIGIAFVKLLQGKQPDDTLILPKAREVAAWLRDNVLTTEERALINCGETISSSLECPTCDNCNAALDQLTCACPNGCQWCSECEDFSSPNARYNFAKCGGSEQRGKCTKPTPEEIPF